MKTHKITTLLLIAALALSLRAADAPPPALTVAMGVFTGEADAASYARNLTTLLTANLTAEPGLVMVERANVSQVLQEQAMGSSGIVSSDVAAQIGQVTGAKIVLAGQVMKIGDNHLVVVANIISTETGRLFAEKIEGSPDKLSDLAAQLSHKIAKTIGAQAASLLAPAHETSGQRLARITNSIAGTNRLTVSLDFHYWSPAARKFLQSATVEGEFASVLLKSGFTVVDDKADRKPDVVIDGLENTSDGGTRQGDLYSYFEVVTLEARERRTGRIMTVDLQTSIASDTGPEAARADAGVIAADLLAERLMPLLVK